METRRYEFLLEAQEPIAHHSESFGNSAIFMRRKVRQLDGSFVSVPTITADTMRHGMREAAAYSLLDAAGILENHGTLTEAALRLLFAGGMVTGRGDGGTVKLDEYRRMAELIPSMALFGGCAGNRVIPGRLTVGDAVLVCEEQWHLIPEWVRAHLAASKAQVDSHRAYVEEVQRVRMDPTLNPAKRLLLTDGAKQTTEDRMLVSESATDAFSVEEAKSSMMPRRFETVVSGSLFFWRVSAQTYSPLDVDTLHLALGAFLSDARIGGKKGTGHGLVRAIAAHRIDVSRPAENVTALDPGKLAPKVGELFRAHIRERSSQVAEFLSTVDA